MKNELFGAHGGTVSITVRLLTAIPRDEMLSELDQAEGEIIRAEVLGPILDPSAWLDRERFKNAEEAKNLIRGVRGFIEAIPDGCYQHNESEKSE